MQLFSASQHPWSTSKLPMPMAMQAPARPRGMGANGKPELCGWYDSSFDLANGLEVSEQDNDTLYQLWELSRK